MIQTNPISEVKAKLKEDTDAFYQDCDKLNNRLNEPTTADSTFLKRVQNLKSLLYLKYFGGNDSGAFTSKYYSEKEGGLRNLEEDK